MRGAYRRRRGGRELLEQLRYLGRCYPLEWLMIICDIRIVGTEIPVARSGGDSAAVLRAPRNPAGLLIYES